MRFYHGLLALSLFSLPVAVGCAGATGEDADSSGAAVTAGTQGSVRTDILNALHARLAKDLAGSSSLKSAKLVFDVHQLESNGDRAFFRGRVLKQDSAGKTHELANADFKGTVYETDIKDGLFDGPEVIAALSKSGGKWSIAKAAYGDAGAPDETLEAWVVGPTDVAWYDWAQVFDFPAKWTGLSPIEDAGTPDGH